MTPEPPIPPTFIRPDGTVIPPGSNTLTKPRYSGPPAPRGYAIAAFVLALLTALILAEQPNGIGLGLLGVSLVGATLLLDTKLDRFSLGCLAGAGILGAVPAFRDSGWVTTLSLLGGLTLASIALTSAKTWRETAVGMFAWWGQLIPAPFLIFAEATRRATGRKWAAAGPVLRGIALAAVLVFVFGALFASADEKFSELIHDLFDWNLRIDSIIARIVLFGVVLTIAGSLWLVSNAKTERPAREPSTKLGRTEWLIALGSLVVLTTAFVILQLPDFFNGDSAIQTTDGLTYASNARLGFVQMTVAALLTLSVIAASSYFGPAKDTVVGLLNGALCLLTIVVLASALHRLGLYQDAYGATRTRFSMHTLMLWLGAVFLVIVVAGAARKTVVLPRVLVALSAVFAIGTVAVNPDGRIAERNIARFADTGTIDTQYLTSMSGDAVPAIKKLPPPIRSCIAAVFLRDLGDRDPVQSFNVGRARARATIDDLNPQLSDGRATCVTFEARPE